MVVSCSIEAESELPVTGSVIDDTSTDSDVKGSGFGESDSVCTYVEVVIIGFEVVKLSMDAVSLPPESVEVGETTGVVDEGSAEVS